MEILSLPATGRLVLVAIAICGCTPVDAGPSRSSARPCRVWAVDGLEMGECEGPRWRAYAICVPPPHGAELRGRVPVGGDQWAPECGADLVTPCELAVVCSADGCSCACDLDGDCRAMAVGASAPLPDGAGVCEAGRCVWAVEP